MAHEYRATRDVDARRRRSSPTSATAAATRWSFDGGITVPASSSPLSVRLPYSVAEAVDPEEALVAALSSCHMLTFLYVAAKQGFVVDAYADEAVGEMTKNERGKLWVSKVHAVSPRSPSRARSVRRRSNSMSCITSRTRSATSRTR